MNMQSEYEVYHGDCIEHMATLPEGCFDFAVFSPPFPALYAYTDSERDIGNTELGGGGAELHLSFFYRQLRRVIKPGRAACVHVMQIPKLKRSGDERGIYDFRGLNIRLAERAGLLYEYDWCIRKNPQSQAIRTRSRELQFAGLDSDRARCRGALSDYIIKLSVPGDNATPLDDGTVTRNQWIQWAEGTWSDIRETDTLNTLAARSENDTRHICPLQLGVIYRLVKLFSAEGEIVFSPFAGIGSEGYIALREGRKFYGCELKDEYHAECLKNCEKGYAAKQEQLALFA